MTNFQKKQKKNKLGLSLRRKKKIFLAKDWEKFEYNGKKEEKKVTF